MGPWPAVSGAATATQPRTVAVWCVRLASGARRHRAGPRPWSGDRRRGRQHRRAVARHRAARLLRAGHARNSVRDDRRGDRQRHPRQEPPHRRVDRQSRRVDHDDAGRRFDNGRLVHTTDPYLFWATIGGMGLTGVMIDATIRLLPIETSRMRVDTRRVADLDALLATMSCGDDDVRYSVAWIDLVAKGRNLGRSVLTRGDHARLDRARCAATLVAPFAYGPHQIDRSAAARATDRGAQPRARSPRSTRSGSARHRCGASARSRGSARSSTRSTSSGRGTACTAAAGWSSTSSSFRSARRTRCARVVERTLGQRRSQLPRSAEAVRRRQPGTAQLSAGRLDARPRRARGSRGLGDLLHGLDRCGARCRRSPLLRQGFAHDARGRSSRLSATRRVEGRPRRGRPHSVCGRAISAAASAWSTRPH